MMCNEGCKGYVMKALNFMIKEGSIDYKTAKEVLNQVNFEFSLLSEEEARQYYINNWIINLEEE